MTDHMELWNRRRTPNPKYVKEFNRGGGFKGSSTNTQYIVQMATEEWGPNGIGWGIEIHDEAYMGGAYIDERNQETIHTVRGCVWYTIEEKNGNKTIHRTSEQFGQTTFVGKNKYGVFTDEEAPKKSVTDMMLKCLSLLGFSADIFLGLWDDNKYVNDVKNRYEKSEEKQNKQPDQTVQEPNPIDVAYDELISELNEYDNLYDALEWAMNNKDRIAKSLGGSKSKMCAEFRAYFQKYTNSLKE